MADIDPQTLQALIREELDREGLTGLAPRAAEGLTLTGTGSPNGVVAAPVGTLYADKAGGAGSTFYVKESGGAGNTGWVAK